MTDKELLYSAQTLIQAIVEPFRNEDTAEIAPQLQETVILGSIVIQAREWLSAYGNPGIQERQIGMLPLQIVSLDESGSQIELRYEGFPVGRMSFDARSLSTLANSLSVQEESKDQPIESQITGRLARGSF